MKIGGEKNTKTESKAESKNNGKGKIPHGREAVKKAILDATEKLLLKKSPNQVTVREIAEAANIKHPLIHRHFETKEKVIIAVHARRIAEMEERVAQIVNVEGSIATFFEAVKNIKFRRIALARAMMDGVSPHAIQTDFPVMKRLLELIRKKFEAESVDPQYSPETITAVLSAAALGWFLYEPFLIASMNIEEKTEGELERTIIEVFEEMIKYFAGLEKGLEKKAAQS